MLVAIAACGMSQRPWRATPAQMAPLPQMSANASSTIGPLALEAGAASTSWKDILEARRITEDHYLDRKRIHEETTTFLTFIERFYRPLTPETRMGFDQAHRDLSRLENLAPYSVWNVTLAFQQSTQRLHLCIHNAGVTAPCERERKPEPAREVTSVFEVGEAAPGIGLLTVRDLHAGRDDAWRTFAGAAKVLSARRGLVIDMRGAAGDDPRPLLAWAAALSGRKALRPLQSIERPPGADTYVDAYEQRYTDRGRDRAVWDAFVAEGDAPPVSGTKTKQPIAIVVGPHCESACELIARVLETYAGAVVIGGVAHAGRLARDEPAMFVLPHSQTSVYFHATRYLLSPEIEAATGPTEEWRALGGDGPDPVMNPKLPYPATDHMTFAVQDVTKRLESPGGWPRCDATPVPAQIADGTKLQGISYLTSGFPCEAGYSVTIWSPAPASALRRFLSTCSTGVDVSSFVPGHFYVRAPAKPSPALLAQIAASELVTRVGVECEQQSEIEIQ
jgi:hypothetical protein